MIVFYILMIYLIIAFINLYLGLLTFKRDVIESSSKLSMEEIINVMKRKDYYCAWLQMSLIPLVNIVTLFWVFFDFIKPFVWEKIKHWKI